MKTALIVVDVQNDYFPGGKMELHNINQVSSVISDVIKNFRDSNLPVIHVQHIFLNDDAPFFVANTNGVEIHPSAKPQHNETLIIKHTPNSFNKTNLDETLKGLGIEEVVVIGAMTHICIDSTVRAASDLGYQVKVISDATATRDLSIDGVTVPAPMVQAAYLAGVNGVFAEVLSLSQLIGRG